MPPLFSCCFSPHPDMAAALGDALNDSYHLAMQTGDFGITAAYDLRTVTGRDATFQLIGQADDLRLAILAIGDALLAAGADVAP
ncbi:hypothetical protein K7W42_13040 [Deinococcus sp. HMF7604]|uniref:hypothetical protein n=1 Tax=Deinococcus betulae TaxID=2873312 RepID=UPI001CCB18F1|nr:hypothetical protein [Deinococcus betulae]MBZ9751783.1 hypothetical protein [Deinococcus betulae]